MRNVERNFFLSNVSWALHFLVIDIVSTQIGLSNKDEGFTSKFSFPNLEKSDSVSVSKMFLCFPLYYLTLNQVSAN